MAAVGEMKGELKNMNVNIKKWGRERYCYITYTVNTVLYLQHIYMYIHV